MDSNPSEIEVRMPMEQAPPPLSQPRGFYLLDHNHKLSRINLCNLTWITGFAWRPDWIHLVDEFGQYDLGDVQEACVRLQAIGKKLSIYVEAEEVPAHVLASATEKYVAKIKGKGGIYRHVETSAPWDRPTLDHYRPFINALSRVPCLDTSTSPHRMIPLKDHPVLSVIRVSPIGRTHFARDLYEQLQFIPGFTRARYISACMEMLTIVQDAFPSVPIHIGFFELKEMAPPTIPPRKVEIQPPLDYALTRAISAKFNNVDRPGIGVFEELLTKRKPFLDTRYSDNLLFAKHRGAYTAFQTIDCWVKPFTEDFDPTPDADGTTPFPAVQHGFDDYGCRYFEMYPPDLLKPEWAGQWQQWHQRLYQ